MPTTAEIRHMVIEALSRIEETEEEEVVSDVVEIGPGKAPWVITYRSKAAEEGQREELD